MQLFINVCLAYGIKFFLNKIAIKFRIKILFKKKIMAKYRKFLYKKT